MRAGRVRFAKFWGENMSKPFPAPQALAVALAGAAAVSLSAWFWRRKLRSSGSRLRSAIRRIEVETALPVTTLTREDMRRRRDQRNRPAADAAGDAGYLTSSDSVNGASAGSRRPRCTAVFQVHAVLIAGSGSRAGAERRLRASAADSRSPGSIPLDAVERVRS